MPQYRQTRDAFDIKYHIPKNAKHLHTKIYSALILKETTKLQYTAHENSFTGIIDDLQ